MANKLSMISAGRDGWATLMHSKQQLVDRVAASAAAAIASSSVITPSYRDSLPIANDGGSAELHKVSLFVNR